MRRFSCASFCKVVAVSSLIAALAVNSQAAVRTWSGSAADGSWNNAGNWDSAVLAGDSLVFGTSNAPLTLNNDLPTADISIAGITLNLGASAYTMNGSRITLSGDITDNETTNAEAINLPMILSANRTATVATGGNLTLGGIISGTGFGLTKAGAGTLTLSAANTYTGATNIGTTAAGGTLKLTGSGTLGNGSSILTIGTGANTGNLDLSAADATVGGLTVSSNTATADIITVGSGRTLTVNGNVLVGGLNGGATTSNPITTLNVTGSTPGVGTLAVASTGASATFIVGNTKGANTGSGDTLNGTLDLTNLGTFNLNYSGATSILGVGAGNAGVGGGGPFGKLILANNNLITVATLNVGINTSGNNTSSSSILLGANNVINVNNINVGTGKTQTSPTITGTIKFNSGLTNPTVTIRAADGSSPVPSFVVGAGNLLIANGSGTGMGGTVDFTGGSVNALVDVLKVGVGTGNSTGASLGNLIFNAGTINANSVTIGVRGATTGAANATGEIDVNGTANLIVNTTLKLADTSTGASTGTTTGKLVLGGGTVTSSANIVNGGGTGSITLSGGTLDLTGHSIGAASPTLTVNLPGAGQSAALANLGGTGINGGGLNMNGAGTLLMKGTNTFTGGTTISSGTLSGNGTINGLVTLNSGNLSSGATAGATTGTLTLAGGLAMNGGNLLFSLSPTTSNLINVTAGGVAFNSGSLSFQTVGTLTGGSYTLLTNSTPLVQGGLNLAQVVVGRTTITPSISGNNLIATAIGGPATIIWKKTGGSGDGQTWDTQTSPPSSINQNWSSAVADGGSSGSGGSDYFYQNDTVIFNDNNGFPGNPNAYNVNINGSVLPAALTVNNSAGDYTFNGGTIDGTTGLIKQGSGILALTSASSGYTGVTKLSGGILSVSTLAAGGTVSSIGAAGTASSNLVFDGGTLQWTGSSATAFNRGFTLTQNGGGIDASPISGALTVSGTLAYSGTGARTFSLSGIEPSPTPSAPTNNTLSSVLADAAVGQATSVSKSGTSTWTLSGANTFTGGVTVNNGFLRLTNAAAAGTGRITVNNGGTAVIVNVAATNAFTLAGGTLAASGGDFTLPATAEMLTTASTTSTIYNGDPQTASPQTSRNIILAGPLRGSGNISVVQAAGLAVMAADSNQGFRLRSTAASDYSGTITVGNMAKFELQTTVAGPFSPAGTGTIVLTGGTTDLNNTVTGTYPEFNLRNNFAGNTTLGNNIQITGTGTVIANMLSDAVSGVQIAPAGSAAILGNLKIGTGQEIATYKGSTNGSGLTLQFQSVTLTGDGATFSPKKPGFGGAATDAGDIRLGSISEQTPGAGYGITMAGLRTLYLTGTNTYTGNTNINSGTVEVTGTLAATGNVMFDTSTASPRLTGTGNVGIVNLPANGFAGSGPTVAAISPGTAAAAIGTLTTHGLQVGGGNYQVDLATGNSSDQIAVLGAASFNSTSTIGINYQSTGIPNGTYTLLTSTGLTRNVDPTLIKPTRQNYVLSYPSNSVVLTVSGTASSANLIWTGNAGSNWDVDVTQSWTNNSNPDFFFQNDNITFNDTSFNPNPVLATTVFPALMTFNNTTNNYNLTGTGAIAGTGGLTKQGTGILTLANTGVNTYTGATAIQNGTLFAGTAGALSSASAVTLGSGVNGGTLDLGGFNATIAGLSSSGSGTNIVTNNGLTAAPVTLTVAGSGTFGGVIQNGTLVPATSTVALTLSSGTEILTGANTYTGATTIAAGATLQIGNGGTSGSIVSTVADNGTLIFNRSDAAALATVISGSGGVQQIGTGR